jgi:hypothetical protein
MGQIGGASGDEVAKTLAFGDSAWFFAEAAHADVGSAELTLGLRQFCQRKTAGPAEAVPATQSPASRANPPHSRFKVKKRPVLGSGFERTECFDAGRLLTNLSYGEEPALKRAQQRSSLRLTQKGINSQERGIDAFLR